MAKKNKTYASAKSVIQDVNKHYDSVLDRELRKEKRRVVITPTTILKPCLTKEV